MIRLFSMRSIIKFSYIYIFIDEKNIDAKKCYLNKRFKSIERNKFV